MTMPVIPILKSGNCPAYYDAHNNMCVPRPGAKPAIAKSGSCPSGWDAHGNYCVKR